MMKKLAIIGAVALVICIVAGCTSPTTPNASPASTASVTSTNVSATNVADLMTHAAISAGYNVSKPFVQTAVHGYTAYAGVINDGPKKLEPYRYNITIWLVPDRATAMKEFNASVAQAKASGYVAWSTDFASWWGTKGQQQPQYPLSQVQIVANEPGSSANINLINSGPISHTDLNLDVGNTSAFTVYTVYQTALAQDAASLSPTSSPSTTPASTPLPTAAPLPTATPLPTYQVSISGPTSLRDGDGGTWTVTVLANGVPVSQSDLAGKVTWYIDGHEHYASWSNVPGVLVTDANGSETTWAGYGAHTLSVNVQGYGSAAMIVTHVKG
jgi:hypothetical protein